MATVSALATTLFLGGWMAPWPINLWDGANQGYWPVLWFMGKVLFFIFLFIWLRGSLPRLRYDQFMALGWKVLIPASLLWIVGVATVRALTASQTLTTRRICGASCSAFRASAFSLVLIVLPRPGRPWLGTATSARP